MMTELERIADQINRAYAGPAWHGPSVLEALEGITPEIASRRVIPSAHTIWELVYHIGAWADIPRRRILGESFGITPDLNFPPMPPELNETSWKRSLDGLAESQRRLLDVVGGLLVSQLDDPVLKDGPTFYVLLHGVAQHHIYHAGQIMILKQ
jgi:DinB superfamily